MNIMTLTDEKKEIFDAFLHSYLLQPDTRSGIFSAFSYSLKAGGKRIRPILTMLACECLGGQGSDALPAALAIEMIHTFSLIHDDLPALDDDGLRRGRPTCHAEFGEATAILAGDALIFQALSVISAAPYPLEARFDIIKTLSDVCGIGGLVQGEYEDVMAEGNDLPFKDIKEIYRKKTSRLFELCMYSGARIANSDTEKIALLVEYGTHIGLAFQAVDDILDMTSNDGTLGKTPGKDLLQDKATVVKALGIEDARLWAEEMTNRAIAGIESFENDASEALREIALSMLKRLK